jgi:DNA-binding response OmpR family regulator
VEATTGSLVVSTQPLDISNLPEHIKFEDLIFNTVMRTVERNGERIEFTHSEFKQLCFLVVCAKNKTGATRKMQMNHLYGSEKLPPDEKILDTRLNSLRKKLRDANSNCYIETIWGTGHQLRRKRHG